MMALLCMYIYSHSNDCSWIHMGNFLKLILFFLFFVVKVLMSSPYVFQQNPGAHTLKAAQLPILHGYDALLAITAYLGNLLPPHINIFRCRFQCLLFTASATKLPCLPVNVLFHSESSDAS